MAKSHPAAVAKNGGPPSPRQNRCKSFRHFCSLRHTDSARPFPFSPVPNVHLLATSAAAQQSGKQAMSLADHRHRFITSQAQRVGSQPSLVFFKLFPANIGLMMVADENAAFFRRQ